MFKTIIVPVDLSSGSVHAQQINLAKRNAAEGAKIVLLHVVPVIPGYAQAELPSSVHEKALDDMRSRLQAIGDAAGLENSETVLHEGQPARAILDHANAIKADLIVIASHDPNISDYLLGSTAARVVRHAHCSTLIVRNIKD